MIMTWQTYKRKFNPDKYQITDYIGSFLIVHPTMIKSGFGVKQIKNVDELGKPLDIVKENCDDLIKKYELIVYYKWNYRDSSNSEIDVYFK